jgi:RNA-directed DNA polymerase
MQATLVNGTDGQHNWNAINWRESNRIVRNLRGRIYKATQAGDYSTVRNLQKLMLRSRSNAYESVRKVTQVNAGKNTAGVDKLLVKTSAARSELVKEVVTVSVWQASVVKRIYIPKANGKQRPLGIPTIRDRVIQAIVKNALEPEWEAKFEGISYGFRPGRSTHDAIQAIHAIACKGKKMWVVDADIKGAFDNIAHQPLLEQIGDFPAKKLVEKWLKAGVMEKGQYSETTAGTPQGGVISPLLANIALHGMELALGIRRSSKYMLRTHERSIVRYADDFVVFCKTAEDAQKAVQTLAQWLKDKGLELSEEKTKIVHLEKGFDFLGFNIRSYPTKSKKPSNDKRQTPYKLRIKPSKKAEQTFRDKVKAIWKEMKGEDITTVIYRINPILKGWGNYYRHVMKRQTFSRLDKWLWKRQMKWAKFKHLQKSSKWIRQKYFGKISRKSE